MGATSLEKVQAAQEKLKKAGVKTLGLGMCRMGYGVRVRTEDEKKARKELDVTAPLPLCYYTIEGIPDRTTAASLEEKMLTHLKWVMTSISKREGVWQVKAELPPGSGSLPAAVTSLPLEVTILEAPLVISKVARPAAPHTWVPNRRAYNEVAGGGDVPMHASSTTNTAPKTDAPKVATSDQTAIDTLRREFAATLAAQKQVIVGLEREKIEWQAQQERGFAQYEALNSQMTSMANQLSMLIQEKAALERYNAAGTETLQKMQSQMNAMAAKIDNVAQKTETYQASPIDTRDRKGNLRTPAQKHREHVEFHPVDMANLGGESEDDSDNGKRNSRNKKGGNRKNRDARGR